ncbi:hypothetical protein BiPBO1_49 [Brucella phage BiPBO1]|uniref:hypothetical protein n=1 Tax=Brucella phage BiPBO1 TaxID=1718278 RepID=UPI00046CC29E|nr:hypothetical protein [Brucella inopinata]YP_009304077.1 hypothetical protein BJD47_gp49 [Brucella phage BiPBO1]ALJ98263.1 hypothetical protein BiPBO1_49 [Brucella phage BiPBO1]KEY03799.1 hypothetical protein IL59_0214335 [Brucella suis bv. 4 str. 40]
MTTLPKEAVKAAAEAIRAPFVAGKSYEEMATAALTAALPFIPAQGAVNIDKIVQPLEDIHAPGGLCRWTDVATAIGEVRRSLSSLEPSAARSLALKQAEAALQKIVNNWGNLHHKDLMQARAAIRSLSSPDHADAGKVEGDKWQPIESAPDHKQGPFLVTNNPKSVNAFGRPSHVWCVGSIHEDDDGSFCAFDGNRKIHDLKMFAVVSAPASEGEE